MKQQRIAFLDYVRVFACFLVILVHASENFYGAEGSTDMAGPQSFLHNEADRLWVSVYDGFSRMSVPLFIIVSAFLLAPMKAGMTTWEFYRKRALRILPPFFVFMVIYSIIPVLRDQADAAITARDLSRILLNFPTLAGHLWFMYPLFGLYLFIPVISPWLNKATEKEERFFIILFLISTCMPFLNRWCGELWGQCFWNEYHMLWYFSGYLGYLVTAHYIRTHITWSRKKRLTVGFAGMIVGAALTIWSFYVQAVPGITHSTPVIEIGWSFCTINCVMLTTVTLPKNLRTLPEQMFSGCKSLRTVNLPSTLTKVGARAFSGTPITNLNVASVTDIDDGAFSGCRSLKTITINSTLRDKLIDDSYWLYTTCFADCPGLQLVVTNGKVGLPAGVKVVVER